MERSTIAGNRSNDFLMCLLAGFSTRMGNPKQHVRIGQKTFLERIIEKGRILNSNFCGFIFVGRENDEISKKSVIAEKWNWLENSHPEDGPLSSIRIGLSTIRTGNGFWLWPVDFPLVETATLEVLIKSSIEHKDDIVIPSYDNRRGHPARFPAWTRKFLFEAPLEEGARWVLKKFPEKILHVNTNDRWVVENLNTPEALKNAEIKLNFEVDFKG
ncbi:MAG: NTP transferase domain-containing protein [Candidatus Riflebacteria bacterium]|nr:NTP transferase domain-containing protein [Candidatus Riflebacteria bacterium]